MATKGRFQIHDPATTHPIMLRVDDTLYELIRHEVQAERCTMQQLLTHVLREGIEARQIVRLERLRAARERMAELDALSVPNFK